MAKRFFKGNVGRRTKYIKSYQERRIKKLTDDVIYIYYSKGLDRKGMGKFALPPTSSTIGSTFIGLELEDFEFQNIVNYSASDQQAIDVKAVEGFDQVMARANTIGIEIDNKDIDFLKDKRAFFFTFESATRTNVNDLIYYVPTKNQPIRDMDGTILRWNLTLGQFRTSWIHEGWDIIFGSNELSPNFAIKEIIFRTEPGALLIHPAVKLFGNSFSGPSSAPPIELSYTLKQAGTDFYVRTYGVCYLNAAVGGDATMQFDWMGTNMYSIRQESGYNLTQNQISNNYSRFAHTRNHALGLGNGFQSLANVKSPLLKKWFDGPGSGPYNNLSEYAYGMFSPFNALLFKGTGTALEYDTRYWVWQAPDQPTAGYDAGDGDSAKWRQMTFWHKHSTAEGIFKGGLIYRENVAQGGPGSSPTEPGGNNTAFFETKGTLIKQQPPGSREELKTEYEESKLITTNPKLMPFISTTRQSSRRAFWFEVENITADLMALVDKEKAVVDGNEIIHGRFNQPELQNFTATLMDNYQNTNLRYDIGPTIDVNNPIWKTLKPWQGLNNKFGNITKAEWQNLINITWYPEKIIRGNMERYQSFSFTINNPNMRLKAFMLNIQWSRFYEIEIVGTNNERVVHSNICNNSIFGENVLDALTFG